MGYRKLLPLLGLLLFYAMPSQATITTHIAHTDSCVTAACSVTITSTTAGSTLVVFATWDLNVLMKTAPNDCTSTAALSDTKGDTFLNAIAPSQWNTGSVRSSVACYAQNIAAANTTVTFTLASAVDYVDIEVIEVLGVKTVSVLDKTASGSTAGCPGACGTATSISSGATATTTAANEYWACYISDQTTGDTWSSATGGFTIREQSTLHHAYLDQIVSSVGASTCGASNDGAIAANALVATFAAPASGTAASVTAGPSKITGPSKTD